MYRVEVHTQARPQVAALPAEALPSYAGVFDTLIADPWSGRPYIESKPDGNIRTRPFGPGGFVTYMILDRDREVHILEVFWVG